MAVGDILATGTWVGVGSGAALMGGAWYMGLVTANTFFTTLLLTALVIFFYWTWLQVSSAFCNIPLIGSVFCKRRMKGGTARDAPKTGGRG